jgi:predicted flap endonuclease-1-like 5' DNA nuclease
MADPYHIDLEQFSMERFRHILETSELLPGRKVLKEKIAERFAILESMGIRNLKELMEALKTKKRVESFSQESGLPQDYLVILRREANSYVPKPFNLKDIPGVDPEYIERLAAVGIKHTRHLFEQARSKSARAELSRLADVPSDDVLELVKLSDLARIGGVGPVFARLLYEAGADTLEELSKRPPSELFERLHATNKEKRYTKIMASLKDVRHCIETARELPKVIEY